MKNLDQEVEEIVADTRETFGSLSEEQLNWKPAADSWSVGQCFDHLIKSNEAFDGEFERLSSGDRKQSFWENYSPLTSFFGNFLLKAVKNDKKKFKAPSEAIVPPSDIPAGIIDRFVDQQHDIREKVKSIENLDFEKITVTSPFFKIMTYRLDKALEIGIEHEKRHIRQAKRVMESARFPG